MLHDHIWQQIAEPGERMLCIKCMIDRTFERLGRKPTFAAAAVPVEFVSPAAIVVRYVHADGRAAAEPC
jgi:hypothetical protein